MAVLVSFTGSRLLFNFITSGRRIISFLVAFLNSLFPCRFRRIPLLRRITLPFRIAGGFIAFSPFFLTSLVFTLFVNLGRIFRLIVICNLFVAGLNILPGSNILVLPLKKRTVLKAPEKVHRILFVCPNLVRKGLVPGFRKGRLVYVLGKNLLKLKSLVVGKTRRIVADKTNVGNKGKIKVLAGWRSLFLFLADNLYGKAVNILFHNIGRKLYVRNLRIAHYGSLNVPVKAPVGKNKALAPAGKPDCIKDFFPAVNLKIGKDSFNCVL